MRTDVNVFIGPYPFRPLRGRGRRGWREGVETQDVRRAMDRVGIDQAWVSHLPAVVGVKGSMGGRALAAANAKLYAAVARERRLLPVPSVVPRGKGWERSIDAARKHGAPAVRCDPTFARLDPSGPAMRVLAQACVAAGLPLAMAVRLEDGRQRVPEDTAPELPPWAVRALIRTDPQLKLLITHADRAFIEEVHFGSTPEEAVRIWWDICWIWGPPEDHLRTLLTTIGPARFVFGSGMPLRIPEASVAKLDLLDLTAADRRAIEHENAQRLQAP